MTHNPYHQGELLLQDRAGARAMAAINGRHIADRIPARAAPFVAQQRMAVVTTRDDGGDLWASVLSGQPGFVTASAALDRLDLALTTADALLPAAIADLAAGDPAGLLLIELATRRRLRVNGMVSRREPSGFAVSVQEAYANCPKFIQRRVPVGTRSGATEAKFDAGTDLDDRLKAWIETSDTLFVGSGHMDGHLDASHRGGNPGFIRITGDALMIPDYPGNAMFNTLGNFAVDPRAGLTVVDFAARQQLQMTGDVVIHHDVAEVQSSSGGTGRWWQFRPRRWITAPVNFDTAWTLIDYSPYNPGSGRY